MDFGASWGPPGHVLGRLGPSWERLGPSWGRLGGVLGRLGGVLVGNMVPTWLPKRSPNRLKIEAKINQFLKASWDLIFMGFWWILEGKWSQVGTQMASKIDANFEGGFFEKTLFFLRKNMVFSKNHPSKLISIFDAIWMPTWLHFASKNPLKSFKNLIPRGIQKLIDFCFDF